MNKDKSRTERNLVINSDWLTAMGMVALFVLSTLSVAADFRRISHGGFAEHVSIGTLIPAVAAISLAMSSVGRLLRSGFLLIGLGASIRAAVFYLHAGDRTQLIAANVCSALNLVGWILISVYAVQWFKFVTRIESSHESDNPVDRA
jgi:uncharacterized membrane protein